MLKQDPVRIPDLPGKIHMKEQDGWVYIRYLVNRRYDPDRKHTIPEWVNIGRRTETMPGLMFPNDNYEKYFSEKGEETVNEPMTPEEQEFVLNNQTYGMYSTFFDALYHEFRQQTRKRPDSPLNRYKAETLNSVLKPLRDMMKDEEYAGMLGLAVPNEDGSEGGMNCDDVMILLTQYKSALAKYRRKAC